MIGVEGLEVGVARGPLACASGEEAHLLHEDASDDEIRPVEAEHLRPCVEPIGVVGGVVAQDPHLLDEPVAHAPIVPVEAASQRLANE